MNIQANEYRTTRLERALHLRAKLQAMQEGCTVTELIGRAVQASLDPSQIEKRTARLAQARMDCDVQVIADDNE